MWLAPVMEVDGGWISDAADESDAIRSRRGERRAPATKSSPRRRLPAGRRSSQGRRPEPGSAVCPKFRDGFVLRSQDLPVLRSASAIAPAPRGAMHLGVFHGHVAMTSMTPCLLDLVREWVLPFLPPEVQAALEAGDSTRLVVETPCSMSGNWRLTETLNHQYPSMPNPNILGRPLLPVMNGAPGWRNNSVA